MSAEPDRRLHPLSLLFYLGSGLKDLAIPFIVAVFATRSDRFEVLLPAATGVIAMASAIAKYLSYTYRYEDDDLVVRTGIFFRNERHIPYDRIQNIDAVQNVAHRFLNVAVVQVQTGSSSEPEATLSVLPLTDLAEMRLRVLDGRRESAATVPNAGDPDVAPIARPAPTRLLHIPPRELLLAGFIENRGMALVAGAMGLLFQVDAIETLIRERLPQMDAEWVRGATALFGRGMTIILGGALLLLLALLLVRGLSTIWAVIRLHDFTLVRDGSDLRAEYGLFTRVTATIPLRRVQTISIHQRWLHRRTGRAAIRVTTAGASGIPGVGAGVADREWLAPIIRTADIGQLIREIDPTLQLDGVEWTPVHPRAAWRLMRVSSLWGAAIAGAAAFFIGWWSLAIGAILGARAVLRARGIAAHLGYAIVGDRIVFRGGWLHRVVRVARFERIQSVVYGQSIFDRRTGMAGVGVDTAGMGQGELRMPYLPESMALRLHTRLTEAAVRTPFTW